MLIPSPAKINLGLQIYEQRPDGYHNLESLFYPLPFVDWIEILPSDTAGRGRIKLTQLNQKFQIAEEEHSLIKAYHKLLKKRNLPSIEVHHYKQIPPGSGLAGGSSNAVALLKALDNILKLNLSLKEFSELAMELGSDCSFFLQDKPCLVSGRGEILKPISISLSNFYLILLYAGIHCPSAEAYSKLIRKQHHHSLAELLELPVEKWKYAIRNDFEEQTFELYPELGNLKEWLYEAGAVYASMTGSGSVVYGIFKEKPQLTSEYLIWQGYL